MNEKTADWNAIKWHAGLSYDDAQQDMMSGLSMAEALWRLKRGEDVDVESAFGNLLGQLQKLNKLVNGMVPSQVTEVRADIPATLVYAVSTLIAQCIEVSVVNITKEQGDGLKCLAISWKLSCAWEGVLAGDIDDLAEHIQLEGQARGIPV